MASFIPFLPITKTNSEQVAANIAIPEGADPVHDANPGLVRGMYSPEQQAIYQRFRGA